MEKKLRWGIIGCASIAEQCVMPAIQQSSTGIIAAVASRDLKKSKAMAKQFKVPRAYGSYDALLQDSDIDAVYIPLPNHLHREWTIRAIEAGKHVLCEKPMAMNTHEAVEMVEASTRAGVQLAEALMYRYHPVLEHVRRLIKAGGIGEIRVLRGAFTLNNSDDKDNIRYRSGWGGGSLYDVGGYPLSAARFFTGLEPEAVMVNAFFSEEHDGVDMMASGLVEFTGGLSLTFDCGLWAEERRSIEIVGTRGRFEIPHVFSGKEQSGYYLYSGRQLRQYREKETNAYVHQVESFARSVFGEIPQRFLPVDAVNNARLLEACLRSAKERRRIILAGPDREI